MPVKGLKGAKWGLKSAVKKAYYKRNVAGIDICMLKNINAGVSVKW